MSRCETDQRAIGSLHNEAQPPVSICLEVGSPLSFPKVVAGPHSMSGVERDHVQPRQSRDVFYGSIPYPEGAQSLATFLEPTNVRTLRGSLQTSQRADDFRQHASGRKSQSRSRTLTR